MSRKGRTMKRLALGSVAGIAMIFTGAAHAADMREPMYKAPVAHDAYSWTGVYLGVHAGYGWGSANDALDLGGSWRTDGTGDNTRLSPLGNGQIKPDGFASGIQAGVNYQIGRWVLGLEADLASFKSQTGVARRVNAPPPGNPYAFTSSFESDWLATVRPRVGYAVDRLLVYATGGWAVGNQNFTQTINQLNVSFVEAGSVSARTWGWTAGAGVEYAVLRHLSLKAEYLYVDLDSVSFSTAGFGPPGSSSYTAAHSAHLTANVVRVGINASYGP